MAHDLLNQFLDGEKGDSYAQNDTYMPLGDLLLNKTRLEYTDSQYDTGSTADLQQIVLEGDSTAVGLVELALAISADADKQTTWLDCLQELSGEALVDNLAYYVPEAEGVMVTPSTAINYLKLHYADAAKKLASQWNTIHELVVCYEDYNGKNGLWQKEGESYEEYLKRQMAFFEAVKEKDQEPGEMSYATYMNAAFIDSQLSTTTFEGDWGETLYDFFNPQNGMTYNDTDSFLPLAAALSEGQRAGLKFLSLKNLLMTTLDNDAVMEANFAPIKEKMKNKQPVSIYDGRNRAIFRDGVALTNAAREQKNLGRDPYDGLWGISTEMDLNKRAYLILMAAGFAIIGAWYGFCQTHTIATCKTVEAPLKAVQVKLFEELEDGMLRDLGKVKEKGIPMVQTEIACNGAGLASTILAVCGVILAVSFAVIKIVQAVKMAIAYYHCTFSKIPTMIVDKKDLEVPMTDKDGNPIYDERGNQKKNIEFDEFQYYQAVKCNRQQIGVNKQAQDGVEKYAEWGCGDVADLNCDIGREWIALYTVKSPKKGNPILADSLELKYGSNGTAPKDGKVLHKFNYICGFNLSDTAYCYREDKGSIYFFWKCEAKPAAAA